ETDLTEMPVGTVSGGESTDVAGVAFTGQFEGQARSVIGLEGADRPFSTFLLQDPPRLVVDIERSARGRARPVRVPPVRGPSYTPSTVQRPDSSPSAQPSNSAADRSGTTCIRARGPRGSPPGPSSHQASSNGHGRDQPATASRRRPTSRTSGLPLSSPRAVT